MSEPNYKIAGLYYSKPRLVRGADGEALPTRLGVYVTVGMPFDFGGIAPREVVRIEFKQDYNEFYIHLKGNALLTVPKQYDTEVYYETFKERKSREE